MKMIKTIKIVIVSRSTLSLLPITFKINSIMNWIIKLINPKKHIIALSTIFKKRSRIEIDNLKHHWIISIISMNFNYNN